MLILGVCHGSQGDPFTCSVDMKAEEFKDDKDYLIDFLCTSRNTARSYFDEIFVILNDDIFRHYYGEDINPEE
jgi:hypothetical protein